MHWLYSFWRLKLLIFLTTVAIFEMSEITSENFEECFQNIKTTLEQSKFVSIDTEFSALHPLKVPSLFDTTMERYNKLRKNVKNIIPLQVGITAFSSNAKNNSYEGTIFNFYVSPATFAMLDKVFYFQASSLKFLQFHHFNFDKFSRLSIPYMNKEQESELRDKLNDINENQSLFKMEVQNICREYDGVIIKWLNEPGDGDLQLNGLYSKIYDNMEILYFVHKCFRKKYKNVWTFEQNGEFVLKKVEKDKLTNLEKTDNLNEKLISNLLGFTKVFNLLVELKKPLIGHNLFQDILVLIENFYVPLPQSYKAFKTLTHNLFPTIFDTRTIGYEIRDRIPKDKRPDDRGLSSIFEYYKYGIGRHLVKNSPAIESKNVESEGLYHQAGWDSFCSGYIFIRMAYLNIYDNYPKSKQFVSSELIGGLMDWKNKLNVIRGFVSSIQLDGEDPVTTRPPYLVVESVKRKPIDVEQVSSVLSSFGFVEVKRLPFGNRSALLAVDNYTNARKILKNFQNHNEYKIKQYSAIKHSPFVRKALMGGITISGLLLLYITYNLNKK